MALIERSSGVVVEAADRRPTSWVPVTKVRDGHQNLATGSEALAHLSEQVRRVDDMLDHIGGNDLGSLLGSLLGGGSSGAGAGQPDGAAILGHIFGGNQQRAEAGLGQATGLGANAGQLLQMLAPIVMSFLAQRMSAGNMNAGGLGQVLGQESARAQQQGGLGGGLLGSLLDQDGDGQVGLGDLLKIGGGLLGGRR